VGIGYDPAMTCTPLFREDKPSRCRGWFASGAVAFAAVILVAGHAWAQGTTPPAVTASSVFVVNADTGQVLYAKNPDKVYRLLSITKLITAYVLMQHLGGELSDPVTVTQAYLVPGATAGLRKGDIWSLRDLLYGMLLVSGNDAALAIADFTGQKLLAAEKKKGSGIKRFVQEMQPTAVTLGAKHSQFADPYGISATNVSTARDIGAIGSTVFRDERLLPFWQCARRTFDVDGHQARSVTINSTIEMFGEQNILGAKTGSYFSKNIYHLVVGWRAPNGQTIVAVVLGAADHPSRYNDMRSILAALPRDFPELGEHSTATPPAPQCDR
jgi:D-alanyl-D-alanine carboxypeptidase (penicillin-binding protein 5/6)